MRGQTNAIESSISTESFSFLDDGISYSYDLNFWHKFGFNNGDIGGCAVVDFENNIIQVNCSGYDEITRENFYDDERNNFYIRLDKDYKIYYCLVGGGGGSSGAARDGSVRQWESTGGGGGAGGQVVYNQNAISYPTGTIFKFQIGTGGAGTTYSPHQGPQQGNSTILFTVNISNNTSTIVQTAVGGAGANYIQTEDEYSYNATDGTYLSGYNLIGTPEGGAGTFSNTNGIYAKSTKGGAGTIEDNTNPVSELTGTQWPQNGIIYGGGGGGAAGEKYYSGATDGYGAYDYYYTGMMGGNRGGGRSGSQTSRGDVTFNWQYSNNACGQPGFRNTGGGAGGSPALDQSADGGSGVCLIKIVQG